MDLRDLFPVAVTFVALGVLLAFGVDIQSDVQSDFVTGASGCNSTAVTGCGADYNATQDAIDANANVADKLPILGTIIVAAIIIGVLVKAFVL